MKNLTITLDEEVSRWARIWAARNNKSVSRLVGELLHQRMLEEKGYQASMRQFLSTEPKELKKDGGYPSREQLHDR